MHLSKIQSLPHDFRDSLSFESVLDDLVTQSLPTNASQDSFVCGMDFRDCKLMNTIGKRRISSLLTATSMRIEFSDISSCSNTECCF